VISGHRLKLSAPPGFLELKFFFGGGGCFLFCFWLDGGYFFFGFFFVFVFFFFVFCFIFVSKRYSTGQFFYNPREKKWPQGHEFYLKVDHFSA
jgi:hypothetical protein